VTHWPFDGMPAERWPEFEIATIEPGRRAVHPVRAAVRTLAADTCCCGNGYLTGAALAEKFRVATLWASACRRWRRAGRFLFSYKLARRVGEVTAPVSASCG